MFTEFFHIQPGFAEDASVDIGDGHDFGTQFRDESGSPRAYVTEALHGHPSAVDFDPTSLAGLSRDDHDATSGGLLASE